MFKRWLVGLLLPWWSVGVMAAPTVFVSILPQKYFVERIAGDAVRVEVLVPPGHSPATYEPLPRQMAALEKAPLYFRIGVAFEDLWLPALRERRPGLRVVDTRQGVELLPMAGAGTGGRLDPHIWTSPRRVRQQAATIRTALSELLPEKKSAFAAAEQRFAAELQQLDSELLAQLAPFSGRPFFVFHPSWGYLAADYGLRQIVIESAGKEPGPQALAKTLAAAKQAGARTIFVQRQFSQQSAAAVAREIGGRVVAIDPLAEDFMGNTRQVARELVSGLAGGAQ